MDSKEDVYTKRPRTPNDQYTVMTDQQIRNVRQYSETFFAPPPGALPWPPSVGLPREGGRYYMDRFCHVRSGGHARGLDRTANILYVDDQIRPHDVPVTHNSSRDLASVKWGPQKTGERTRKHFFGEEVEDFSTIDMYRRPATTYTGRIVMDYGRPGDGYYTQRFPNRVTWNQSTAKLNCTNIMESSHRKTFEDYDALREAEQTARQYRKGKWPEYSEYTDRYLLRSKISPLPSKFELSKQHALLGQQLQAAELAQKQEELSRRCTPRHGARPQATVIATDAT